MFSKYTFAFFIVGTFILWKVLDSLALPNTFAIILVILSLVTGFFWCYNRFVLREKEKTAIAKAEKRLGHELDEETIKKMTQSGDGARWMADLFPVLFFILIIRSFVIEPFQIPSGSMEPNLLVGDFIAVEKYAYGIKDPIFQTKLISTGEPKRGDVVVFKAPPQPNLDYIKRVVGLPGDHISYNQQEGALTVTPGNCAHKPCKPQVYTYSDAHLNPNFIYYNMPQIEEIEHGAINHTILLNPVRYNVEYAYYKQPGEPIGQWTVPAGHYFMMGDNRDNSDDSRDWGFVPEQALVGKAEWIWMSLNKKPNEWPTGIRTDRIFTKIQ